MGNLEGVLSGPWHQEPAPPEEQLRLAMSAHGLEPEHIQLDGQIHRFRVGNSKDAGWYVAYSDGVPAGRFGNWQDDTDITWRADVGRELTTIEQMAHTRHMVELKAKRDADRRTRHEMTANVVTQIWESAGLASDEHPYLRRKGVRSHGLRITGDGRLIAPLYSPDGMLSSLQYISADGEKRYQSGGSTKGCFFLLGELANQVYIAEGYATGATVYEHTGKPVVIAYSAGNLVKAAEVFSEHQITVIADNDASGTGQNYADQVAAKYGARVILPPNEGDVNDYMQAGGDLEALLGTDYVSKFSKYLIREDNLHEAFTHTLNMGWVVKNILPESSGLSMFYGAPGTYKSFIVIDLVLSIANGVPWQGMETKQRNVLYIAAEGQAGVLKRFEAWRIAHNIDRLHNISLLPLACILDDNTDVIELMATLKSEHTAPDYIVFDTLARSMAGEENAKVDMAKVINAVDTIRHEVGSKVIVVHHCGKNDKGPRGSGSLEGATDTMFKVARGNDKLKAVLTCERQKDDEAVEDIGFSLDIIDTGKLNIDGDRVTSLVPRIDADVKAKEGQSKRSEFVRIFENAWLATGREILDGYPYVSRSAMREKLLNDGYASRTVDNMRSPSYPKLLIGLLINERMIEGYQNGWIVTDPVWKTALMISP